ncbi:MAG: glycosyltransferase, partial [Candidatus Moranbacteria bacterium]|nr:glycosyltransferase [Candidatus Moranbacteria bacterium]
MAYKKLDLVVQAFNRTGLQLKIIGRGPEYQKLKEMAKGNIEFLGRVSDEELPGYYTRCRAFIFPQEEDFGIVAIEAMASGRPIIAFRGGDIPEHIEEGKTGLFFEEQTAQAIIEAVGKFNDADYDPAYIRGQAEKFDKSLFKARIKEYIDGEYKKFKESN